MKFKIVQFDDGENAYIVINKRGLAFLIAAGFKPTVKYQGHEVDAQRGRWAGEFQFGAIEDAKVFADRFLEDLTEVEEVVKEVDKEESDG